MSSDIPLKAAVTVAEMARMCGLSRARFYQLQKAGVFHFPRFSDKGRKLEPGYPTYYARRTETARPA